MVKTLKIADGKHILVSKTLLGIYIDSATKVEINEEKESLWQHAMF